MTIVLYSEAKDRCHRRKAILARHVRRQGDPEDLDGNSSETRGMPERATKHVHTNRHTYVRTYVRTYMRVHRWLCMFTCSPVDLSFSRSGLST